MVSVKLSESFEAIRSRMRRLPVMMPKVIKAFAKHDAEELIRLFHDGIQEGRFELMPLQPRTIRRKEAMGYGAPDVPLHGKGDEDQSRSYMNMLRIRQDGRRYRVIPSRGYHWSKKIKLTDLFMVHEYGCTITNGFGVGITIRLPPRPALRYAYRDLMVMKSQQEPSDKVRMAMLKYVMEANEEALKKIIKRDTMGDRDYENDN